MKVKKLLSFILTAALMLSVYVIPVAAEKENEVTVHYYNENNWENPYIYYYNDESTPVNWPGVAMTSDGNNWYSYTISDFDYAKVIFSDNGNNQYPAQNQEGLTVSGEQWYKSGNFYNQNPDLSKIRVHYYNTNGWSSPYIYYYTDSANPVTWPGVAMTSDGNGWYSYDIYGYDSAKVIFSDNGNNQDPAQNQPGYDVNGEKWYISGKLYDSEPDGITVHFYNSDNWNNVNIYYYNGNITGSDWTGVPMSADGNGWYTYKIYGLEEAKVLFNNGAGVQIPGVMEEGFTVSGEMWYRNGEWTKEPPKEITVYFYKPDNWSAPNIYYYVNDNDTGPSWPGVPMEEVSDGWYSYNITKYSFAKVIFNDGNNRIPGQNQPGLDASGIMWYKNGVWCDSETDTDGDELLDFMEMIFGADINKTDTDGDQLPDGYEVNILGTDPTKNDTDSNGTSDSNEDADSDGLTNLREYQFGTDPTITDSDGDGLTDSVEVNAHHTDPMDEDTDNDGANDGWEVEHNYDPLVYNNSFTAIANAEDEENNLSVSVVVSAEGSSAETVQASFLKDSFNINSTIPGYIGQAVELSAANEINSGILSFTFDESLLEDEEFIPAIYYYNETTQLLEELPTTVTGNVASANLSHFSTYILLNKTPFNEVWQTHIRRPEDNAPDKMRVVFVVDCSGSMYGTKLTTTRSVLHSFVDVLDTDDEAAIITFDSSASILCGLTSNKSTVSSAINNTYANGNTAIYTGLSEATQLLNQSDSSDFYNIIIVITDGYDEPSVSYQTYYAPIVSNAANNHFKIYSVGIESVNDSLLNSISTSTDGAYFHADNISDLEEQFEEIKRETVDFDTDSNEDGISDYYTSLLAGGDLRYGTRAYVFGTYTETEFIHATEAQINANDDFDGDTLKNGTEINIATDSFGHPYVIFLSDPSKEDSDEDGYLDKDDHNKMDWDVGDRDLAMFSALCYGEGDNLTNGFYNTDLIDQYYRYWLNFANISELNQNWKIISYVNVSCYKIVNMEDHFSATAYQNGKNIVVAFRGTNETIDWVDDFINYGAGNFHSQELAAISFINSIYKNFIIGHPDRKLYITGHSLGGYLAQIAAAELIKNGYANRLEKVVYFNGMGLLFNRLSLDLNTVNQKRQIINKLKEYGNFDSPNGKLICYRLNGDLVSKLGEHCGCVYSFDVTTASRRNHAGKHGTYSLDSLKDILKSITNMLGSFAGYLVGSAVSLSDFNYYYSYYAPQSFIEYMCITHETVSFLYYLHQGIR